MRRAAVLWTSSPRRDKTDKLMDCHDGSAPVSDKVDSLHSGTPLLFFSVFLFISGSGFGNMLRGENILKEKAFAWQKQVTTPDTSYRFRATSSYVCATR